jgi:cytochrome c5
MLLIVAAAAAAALFAQASPAAETTTATRAEPAAAAPAAPIKGRVRKDGRICRAEPVLGSRLPVTLCATAEEWEARRQNDKETLDKIQHGIRNPQV